MHTSQYNSLSSRGLSSHTLIFIAGGAIIGVGALFLAFNFALEGLQDGTTGEPAASTRSSDGAPDEYSSVDLEQEKIRILQELNLTGSSTSEEREASADGQQPTAEDAQKTSAVGAVNENGSAGGADVSKEEKMDVLRSLRAE